MEAGKATKSLRGASASASTWLLLTILSMSIVLPASASATAKEPANHEAIMHALRFSGMTMTANALDNIIWNLNFMVVSNPTLFIPTNEAMEPVVASLNYNATLLRPLLEYHIVTQNLPIAALLSLPVGTELETMLPEKKLVVTSNSPSSFQINDLEIMPQDICTTTAVSCYAMRGVLNSSLLDAADGFASAAATPLPSGALPPVLSPPGLPLPPLGAPVVPPSSSPLGSPVPLGAPPPAAGTPASVPAGTPTPSVSPPVSPPAIFPPPVNPGSPASSPVATPGAPGAEAPGASAPGASPESAPSSSATMLSASLGAVFSAMVAITFVL